jgi:hypothetical protein
LINKNLYLTFEGQLWRHSVTISPPLAHLRQRRIAPLEHSIGLRRKRINAQIVNDKEQLQRARSSSNTYMETRPAPPAVAIMVVCPGTRQRLLLMAQE